MISINNGETKMTGTTLDLMTDMTTLLHCYYSMMKDDFGEAAAGKMLALIGKVAIYEPHSIGGDLDKECRKEFDEMIDTMVAHYKGKGV